MLGEEVKYANINATDLSELEQLSRAILGGIDRTEEACYDIRYTAYGIRQPFADNYKGRL